MFLILFVLFLFIPEQCSPTTIELLFANRRDLRSIQLQPNLKQRHNTTVLIPNLKDATSLDIITGGTGPGGNSDTVCWSDIKEESIQCIQNRVQRTITTNLPAPEDIAIDWLCNNLYWTDSDTNRIEVVSLREPYHRKVLVWEELDQPRAIVVDSNEGVLFWSDWGEVAKIEVVDMDGNGRRTLVSTNIIWPNGLTLDYNHKLVYWIDGKLLQIGFIGYDGSGRGKLEQSTSLHPFALVYSSELGVLFWSDWNTNSLHYMPTGQNSPPRTLQLRSNNLQPMDLILKSANNQPLKKRTCSNQCTHLTLINPSNYTCSCPTGIGRTSDGRCKDTLEQFLLIARSTEIRLLSLDTPSPDVDLSVPNLHHILALDYYNSTLYWTDDELRQINSYNLITKKSNTIASTEITHPDGIAVDYNAEQVYWTDAGTDKIEVSKLDGSARRVIISRGLYEPRAIAVDWINGLLFWSDWGRKPKIEKSFLDGSNRAALLQNEIEWPNGLALNPSTKTLFFCDASTDRIESISYNGKNRRILLQSNLPHPFGFSYLEPYVYWTDWQLRTVERVREDGTGRQVVLDPFPDPMGIRTVSSATSIMESTKNPCYHGGPCQQLCFYNGTHPRCDCGTGFELGADGRSCNVPSAYIVFTKNNGDINKLSLTTYLEDLIPLSKIRQALAIGIDHSEGDVYWSDGKSKSIWKGNVETGWGVEKLIDTGLQHPESLAIDYSGRLLYLSDVGRIEVVSLHKPHYRRVIVYPVDSPKSIAIEYARYKLYYSSWGQEPCIESADMDGSNRRVHVKTNGRVNGLVFDSGWLYWANIDAGTVERYDGRVLEIVTVGQSPYSLAIWGDTLYYSDLASNRILSTPKLPSNTSTVLLNSIEVLDMSVYNKHTPSQVNYCEHANCSHICFNTQTGFTCNCPTHYEYEPVNGTCIEPTNYLLLASTNNVLRLLNDQVDVVLYSGLKKSKVRRLGYWNSLVIWNDMAKWGPLLEGSSVFTVAGEGAGSLIYYVKGNYINVTTETSWSGSVYKSLHDNSVKNLLSNDYLYFSIDNSIYRVDLDGLNEHKLVLKYTVLSMCLDSDTDHLFFYMDQSIYSTNLELVGYNLITNVGDVLVPKMAVLGPYLYFVTNSNLVERILKSNGTERKRVGTYEDISDLIAVQTQIKKHTTPSTSPAPIASCHSSSCSHICLPPTGKCACPQGLQLQPDGRNCVQKPDQCPLTMFKCSSGSVGCVPNVVKCNGVRDCYDGSDEIGCCTECQEFQCERDPSEVGCPVCYTANERCDGIQYCALNTDEVNCRSNFAYAVPIGVGLLLLIGLIVTFYCKRRHRKLNRRYLESHAAVNGGMGQQLGTADTLLSQSTSLPRALTTTPSDPFHHSDNYSTPPLMPLLYSIGPPPTPCSTDVCDESEVIYVPPPPSPHTSNSTGSIKYSFAGGGGVTPGPPPPSPVL